MPKSIHNIKLIIVSGLFVTGLSSTAFSQTASAPAPTPAAKPAAKAKEAKAAQTVKVVEEKAAPAAKPSSEPPGDKIQLKFNTEADPSQTDVRAPIQFKIPGVNNSKPTEEETSTISEDAPFKAYVGYPKNSVGVFVEPMNLASHWEINGSGLNYADSPIGYGINYVANLSPLMNLGVEYFHFSDTIASSKVTSYIINSSTHDYSTLFVNGSYCFVSDLSAFNRWCPGLTIGRDEYPILVTAGSNTTFALGAVADYVVGVNLAKQFAVRDNFIMNFEVGYNLGTGMGNSGSLTSTTNSSYYLKGTADWMFKLRHSANFKLDYTAREADLEGKNNAGTIKWTTSSTVFGGRVGYTYTFE